MTNFDVIVIGGGVIGSAIVREMLARKLQVICLESDGLPEASASLAAGAMLGAFGEVTRAPEEPLEDVEIDFRVESDKLYRDWTAAIASDADQPVTITEGTFIVANTSGKDDDDNVRAIYRAALAYQQPAEWVDGASVPGLRPHQTYRPSKTLFLPREGSVDSSTLMDALRKANRRKAPGVYVQGNVVQLRSRGHQIAGVITEAGTRYEAPIVILCCGESINDLIRNSGFGDLGIPTIVGGKGSSLLLHGEIKVPHVIRTPNRDFACGTHIVPRGDGSIYVGATNRISATPGSGRSVTAGELHTQLHSVIHEINTTFRTSAVSGFRYGVRPLCVDGYPIVGETTTKGLLVATGTYRNGMLMAPLIARIIDSEIADELGPSNPFAPSRRPELLAKRVPGDVIENGVRDLISFIQEPHGTLPYNRGQELCDLVTVLLKSVLSDTAEYDGIVQAISHEFHSNPMPELIPSLLYTVHEHREGLRSNVATRGGGPTGGP